MSLTKKTGYTGEEKRTNVLSGAPTTQASSLGQAELLSTILTKVLAIEREVLNLKERSCTHQSATSRQAAELLEAVKKIKVDTTAVKQKKDPLSAALRRLFKAKPHIFVYPNDYEDDAELICGLAKHHSRVMLTNEDILDKLGDPGFISSIHTILTEIQNTRTTQIRGLLMKQLELKETEPLFKKFVGRSTASLEGSDKEKWLRKCAIAAGLAPDTASEVLVEHLIRENFRPQHPEWLKTVHSHASVVLVMEHLVSGQKIGGKTSEKIYETLKTRLIAEGKQYPKVVDLELLKIRAAQPQVIENAPAPKKGHKNVVHVSDDEEDATTEPRANKPPTDDVLMDDPPVLQALRSPDTLSSPAPTKSATATAPKAASTPPLGESQLQVPNSKTAVEDSTNPLTGGASEASGSNKKPTKGTLEDKTPPSSKSKAAKSLTKPNKNATAESDESNKKKTVDTDDNKSSDDTNTKSTPAKRKHKALEEQAPPKRAPSKRKKKTTTKDDSDEEDEATKQLQRFDESEDEEVVPKGTANTKEKSKGKATTKEKSKAKTSSGSVETPKRKKRKVTSSKKQVSDSEEDDEEYF